MPMVAVAAVFAVASAAAAGYSAYQTNKQSKKTSQEMESQRNLLADIPKAEATAEDQAKAQQVEQRKAVLASGGQTQLTGFGGAPVGAGQTQTTSLLGA